MLTPSELRVLKAYAGLNSAEKVAVKLKRSRRTIHFHCKNINDKFVTNCISKSCIKAIKSELISLPEIEPIDLKVLTKTQLAVVRDLLDYDLEMQKVIEKRNISKRTLDYHLNESRKRSGAFDTLDLVLMVMVSL